MRNWRPRPASTRCRRRSRRSSIPKAKIPGVEKIGGYYYNFWKDAQHPRGLWRRTTLDEYRKPEPRWETVIDLDALGADEHENWVWHGADCLRENDGRYRRCLVALSRGGADADVTREFDLDAKDWVQGGFFRPEAKGGLSWIDRDHVYVGTDFGPGSMTTSGYARIAKRWTRGTPMSAATTVYEGKPDDLAVGAFRDRTPGFERDFVDRTIAFWNDELFLRGKDGTLTKIDAPNSAGKGIHREWLTLQLREPWSVGGHDYPAGALLATKFDDFMAGKRDFAVLFTPSDTTSLEDSTWTKGRLVLNILDDVKSRLEVLDPAQGWKATPFTGRGGIGTLGVGAVDADDSDDLWLTETGFLTPTTLSLWKPGREPEALKSTPRSSTRAGRGRTAFRDLEGRHPRAVLHRAAEGPRVRRQGADAAVRLRRLRGLAGAGVFGCRRQGVAGTRRRVRARQHPWRRRIRPALAPGRAQGHRHKAYEDFAAIAQDLAARKVATPAHLGIMGGSNGGLLTGNMLVQYPQLFGAVVIQVPLLDMKRYSHLLAGASWMAEYGDPDTSDWDYIKTFSPYQLFDPAKSYPPTFIWTTTRDDRVHPGHARKMAAKMLAADKDVRYYENTEGGHGAGATNRQQAHLWALTYAFLWNELAKP